MKTFDYVIVGAGSAGSALASRLSEDGKHSVLVLEFGGSDRSIFIQMPAALSIPLNMKAYNWGYWSEPEPQLNNRRISCPRGKALGGSSSINGLVYVRGHALDFDRWEAEGARGWSYAKVLPYFRRAESFRGAPSEYRGADGPLVVTPGGRTNPLFDAFIEAGRQAGYPVSADLNGAAGRGLRRLRHDGEGRRALVGRQRLSAPGDEAAEPRRRDPCAGDENPVRGPPRRRRRLRAAAAAPRPRAPRAR